MSEVNRYQVRFNDGASISIYASSEDTIIKLLFRCFRLIQRDIQVKDRQDSVLDKPNLYYHKTLVRIVSDKRYIRAMTLYGINREDSHKEFKNYLKKIGKTYITKYK